MRGFFIRKGNTMQSLKIEYVNGMLVALKLTGSRNWIRQQSRPLTLRMSKVPPLYCE
jgi:hypothetical protein